MGHPPSAPPGSPNGSFLTVTWIALYIKNMDVDLLHLFILQNSPMPSIYLFIFQNPPPIPFYFIFSLKKFLPRAIDLLN
jgi:hypothetical protein